MVCIYCGNDTKVTNSRHQKAANQVWRRRRCLKCGNDFTTHEIAALDTGIVVKRNGALLPFSIDEVFVSLYQSCMHRPKAVSDARGLTSTVVAVLKTKVQAATLDRTIIVETCYRVLSNFDSTAAAVYKAYHKV